MTGFKKNNFMQTTAYKTILAAKLHGIQVSRAELHYEGSCGIPQHLMCELGIDQYEQIHIYNLNNGKRFITYAISIGDADGVHLLGAAARCGQVGDQVIIAVYRNISVDASIEPKIWP